jgi:hypothetical protein
VSPPTAPTQGSPQPSIPRSGILPHAVPPKHRSLAAPRLPPTRDALNTGCQGRSDAIHGEARAATVRGRDLEEFPSKHVLVMRIYCVGRQFFLGSADNSAGL